MRKATSIIQRKNWYFKTFLGMMAICVIILSSMPTTALSRPTIKPISEIVENTREELENMFAEDLNVDRMEENAYDQISDDFKPSNESFPIYSTEFSEISNTITNELYNSWLDDPSYSFLEQEVLGWDITTIQTPEQAVSIHETTTADGIELVETTTYSGRPTLEILSTGDSIIDNINVPVLPESTAGSGAATPEYHTETHRINFGWSLPSIRFEKSFSAIVWPVIWPLPGYKVSIGAYCYFTFHLYFPVDVTITYPTEIYAGQMYEFNCTVEPINDPSMKEFEYLLDAGVWYNVYEGWYHLPWCNWKCSSTCCGPWPFDKICVPCKCGFDCHSGYTSWNGKWGNSWSLKDILPAGWLAASADYQTPLGGNSIPIPLPEIDILDIIGIFFGPVGVISNFFSVSLGLGTADVYGDAVTAIMSILSNQEQDNLAIFTDQNKQTETTYFMIPDSEETPTVEFAVTQFEYKFKEIVINPYFYIGFDNWGILPLRDWWGGLTIPLPQFAIPFGLGIGSDFAYHSKGISVTEDYDAIYDFDISVSDWYSGSSPYGNMNRYLIDITNPNLEEHQNDMIKLSVSGLPEGYAAKFDAPRGEYTLTGTPQLVEISFPVWSVSTWKWAMKTVYIPFGIAGTNRGLLTILRKGPTDAPPGDLTFDIIANSTQRVNHELPDPAIFRTATLNIPEVYGVKLELDTDLYNGIPVMPGEFFPIEFFGQNLGNVNDTVNISASIDLGDSEKTWSTTFDLGPYGSTSEQYFSGQFGFTYDRTDLFPNPGVYLLEITANSSKTALIDKKLKVLLNFTNAYGIDSSISPIDTTVFANWQTNFTLVINNTGNVMDNFTIESKGWDDYLTFPQRVTNVESLKPQEVIVSLNISNPGVINPGTYSFRIEVKSEGDQSLNAFSVHDVNVTILAPDYVPPGIVSLEAPGTFGIRTYPESPLSLGPAWMAFDDWNDTYTIYINGSVYDSGTWDIGIPVQAPVTGVNPLTPGLYNITIAFRDQSANTATAEKWVKIVPLDTTSPVITFLSGTTTLPLNFSSPQSFYWNCTEEYPLYYEILVNGIPQELIWQHNLCMKGLSEDFIDFKFNYTIHPQTLSEGVWNITFLLQDMSNNIVTNSIFITIVGPDNNSPGVTEFPIPSANLGYGATFQLTATDTFPDVYSLWKGTSLLSSGSWESGVPLVFDVDDSSLTVGNNDLKYKLIDLAGNQISYQWTFELFDIDPPNLLASPPNLILYEHNYTQVIFPFWVVNDLDFRGGSFTINLDGVTISEGGWTNANGTIPLPIHRLLPGIHQVDAYFYDASGNTRYSECTLTLYDITKPALSAIDNVRFEPLYTADWFEFYFSELHPAQYSLYRNGTLVDGTSLTSGFPYVFVRITDLSTGLYNYTLVVEDESGNIGQLSVKVHVTDYNPPLIVRPSDMVISEGSLNQIITWEIREANPKSYSLYQNGVLIGSGALTESYYTHSLAGLAIGDHTYTLVVYDTSGQSHTSTCYITVADMSPPTLSRISDVRFLKSDPNAFIIWQAYDLHPSSYIVTTNGAAGPTISWDGSEITVHCDGWAEGNYTLLLQVSDTSGNLVSDEVKVEIFLIEARITEAQISSPGFTFVFVFFAIFISIWVSRRRKKPRT